MRLRMDLWRSSHPKSPRTRIGLQKAQENLDGGGFPGPVEAQQPESLSGWDLQVQGFQGMGYLGQEPKPSFIGLRKFPNTDGRARCRGLSFIPLRKNTFQSGPTLRFHLRGIAAIIPSSAFKAIKPYGFGNLDRVLEFLERLVKVFQLGHFHIGTDQAFAWLEKVFSGIDFRRR